MSGSKGSKYLSTLVRKSDSHCRSESLAQRQRHVWFSVLSASVHALDFVTLKYQANKRLLLAISPHPVGPSASSAESFTGQKSSSVLYWHVERVPERCRMVLL
jgi:hypothetical protein